MNAAKCCTMARSGTCYRVPMRVSWIVIVALIAGCKEKGDGEDKASKPVPHTLIAPQVQSAAVLATNPEAPRVLMILDPTPRFFTATGWADLDAGKVEALPKPPEPADDDSSPDDVADPEHPPEHWINYDRETEKDPVKKRRYALEDHVLAVALPNQKQLRNQQEVGEPTRAAVVSGISVPDGNLDELEGMILIAPTAPAMRLVEAVHATKYAIAVMHAGKIRPLRIKFGPRDSSQLGFDAAWFEVRVSATGILLEGVPDAPIFITDLTQLAGALATVRKARSVPVEAPLDVLVDPDVPAQRLVDVLEAANLAGITGFGLGSTPSAEELGRRGHPMTALRPDVFFPGKRDHESLRPSLRATVIRARPKVVECYEKLRAQHPSSKGRLFMAVWITASGTVRKVVRYSADQGLDRSVEPCIADVLKGLEFPKRADGPEIEAVIELGMEPNFQPSRRH